MTYNYLILEKKGFVSTLWLNRPAVHNAFNEEMILELIGAFDDIAADDETRVLILKGSGKSFCAGADLKWMKQAAEYTEKQNFEESLNLSLCLNKLYNLPKPTIALVHGVVYGGGNGLMSACDFVYAYDNTHFSLSEVNLGLIPACISPYVLKKVGERNAKSMMLRGNRFETKEAKKYGLIDEFGWDELENQEVQVLIDDLLSSGPAAIAKTKELIHANVNTWTLEEAKEKTAQWIAEVRISEEAQEGMKAFFEKRKTNWIKE